MVTNFSLETGNIKALNEYATVTAIDREKHSITFLVNPSLPFEHREGVIMMAQAYAQRPDVNLRPSGCELTFWSEKTLCNLAFHGVKFEGDKAYRERARELGMIKGLPGQESWVRS